MVGLRITGDITMIANPVDIDCIMVLEVKETVTYYGCDRVVQKRVNAEG